MKEKPRVQMPLDFEGLEGKLRRRTERIQAIARLHHCAFRHQWKADNKPNDANAMEAAFVAQQKQMAARTIRVRVRFANGGSKSIQEILNSDSPDDHDSDLMLSAIYVTGLEVTMNNENRRPKG